MNVPDLSLQEPLHITAAEWSEALHSIAVGKAVAPRRMPAILWKELADQLGECMGRLAYFPAGRVTFPLSWCQAFLCMLPKPNKPPRSPDALRPVSLLNPASKALGRILAKRLIVYAQPFLASLPQFAYVQHRGVSDALGKVLSHFWSVRQNIQGQITNIHKKREGHAQVALTGGLTLSFDLSRAFDTLPHDVLFASLLEASVPSDLARFTVAFHRQIKFCLDEHGIETLARRGIRQGCPLAPMLWAIATGSIIRRLQVCNGQQWVEDTLSVYADDFISTMVFDSPASLNLAMQQGERLLNTLAEYHLGVSLTKTVALFEARGMEAEKARAQYLDESKTDHFVRVGGWRLPHRLDHEYLGVKSSYRGFERATYTHRRQKATKAYCRLIHVLKAKRSLSVRTRLRLWYACVWSVLKHGLSTVGISKEVAEELTGYVAKQLRTIAGSHSQFTHKSNEDFFTRLGLTLPVTALRQEAERRVEQRQLHHVQPARVPQCHTYIAAQFATLEDLHLTRTRPRLIPVDTLVSQGVSCPECGQSFATEASMRLHQARKHKQTVRQDAAEHGVQEHWIFAADGMPECALCNTKLKDWWNFGQHVAFAIRKP